MEAALRLTPEEARTYSKILDAVAVMPKSDPRFALIIGIMWWLLHRRRRLEQQRIRRRQFYRRFRRLVLLRFELQKNVLTGVSSAMRASELDEFAGSTLPEQRMWVKNTLESDEDFWPRMEKGELTPGEFSRKFHMSKETFDFIYNELGDNLIKSTTSMRDALPGKKRLAATIYRIATNAEYLKVASLFGIGKSTTTSLVRDVCEIIVEQLGGKYINWSTTLGESLEDTVAKSEITFGIPQCIGILGSMDISIVGSSWNWTEATPYSSLYSKTHALAFQAVVGHDGHFSHVVAGSPAGVSNYEILENSNLKEVIEENFIGIEKVVSSVRVPVLLASDRSYPLEDWLMTPYKIECDKMDTDDDDRKEELNKQNGFNDKISKAQGKFAEAMKKLKLRWKIFHGKGGKISFNNDGFENIAMTCCILHNICEMRGDKVIDPAWSTEGIDDELSLRVQSNVSDLDLFMSERNATHLSKEIRDALANNIFEKSVLLKYL